jgi:hypothetical protein
MSSLFSLTLAWDDELLITKFTLKEERRRSKMQRNRFTALFNKYRPAEKGMSEGTWKNFKTTYLLAGQDIIALITYNDLVDKNIRQKDTSVLTQTPRLSSWMQDKLVTYGWLNTSLKIWQSSRHHGWQSQIKMIQTKNIGLNLVVGSELHFSSFNPNLHNLARCFRDVAAV